MRDTEEQLIDLRRRTRLLTQDLTGEQLSGPKLPIVNHFLWELGHVAWFQERWCLRHQAEGLVGPSSIDGADALYDSSRVPHGTRWDLPLPDLRATQEYQARVLERVLQRIEREPGNESLAYFAQLSLFHEDMHAEAFRYMRQALRYPEPELDDSRLAPAPQLTADGDARIAAAAFQLGAMPGAGFVFDNEKWAHEVPVPDCSISRVPITNAEFALFVDTGGYARQACWSAQGWDWKERALANSPRYWAKCDGVWVERRFQRLSPLDPDWPVMHVNWHEAKAYCRYAGRRLPTEAEWECAACGPATKKPRYPWGDAEPANSLANLGSAGRVAVGAMADGDSPQGCRQLIGNVWEWTESAFLPYPGFVPDAYKGYSEPWFGTRKVLRGGSFATPARLIRNTWRNFYTPERNDIFAGFRTCALNPA
jgi:iron(II)-dependent oxidoreductase